MVGDPQAFHTGTSPSNRRAQSSGGGGRADDLSDVVAAGVEDRRSKALRSITAKSEIRGAPVPASGSPVSRPRSTSVAAAALVDGVLAGPLAIAGRVAISCR